MALALVLAAYGRVRLRHKALVNSTISPEAKQGQVWSDIELKDSLHYELKMGSAHHLPLNHVADISATLTGEDEAVVFALEDGYWHARGTWQEGGESGTWEEANAVSNFNFRVPATGEYDLEVTLDRSTTNQFPLRVQVLERDPFALREWPLLFAALCLLIFAIWVALQRHKVLASYLVSLRRGSRLTIGGVEYQVLGKVEYSDFGEVGGTELRMRSTADDTVRHLSIEQFEREYQDSEGDDQIAIHHQLLIDVPVTADQSTLFEKQSGGGIAPITFRGEYFRVDHDNSGAGRYSEERSDQSFRGSYRSTMYRDPTVFPNDSGCLWVERIEYENDSDDYEWSVMEVLDWKTIDVVEAFTADDEETSA